MNTKKLYAVLNFIAILFPVIALITDQNPGGSIQNAPNQFPNLITPAPYTFSIWFLIYLGLIVFGVHQLKVAFGKTQDEDTLYKVGPYLILALFFNALWSYVWEGGYDIIYSSLLLFAAFFSLIAIIVRMKMQLENSSEPVKRYTWIPISIFAGWMMAASVVGLTTYFSSLGMGQDGSAVYWSVFVLMVVFGLYYYMLSRRNLAVYALVGVWTLIGISVNQWNVTPWIQWTALIEAIALLGFTVQAIQNKKTKELTGVN